MKKRITVIVAVMMSFMMLSACAAPAAPAAPAGGGAPAETAADAGDLGDPVNIRLGHVQNENDIWHLASVRFQEEVERLSGGNITVTIFPNSTLGGDRDMGEGMQIGVVDMALIAGVLGVFEPTVLLLELPYLFESQDEFDRVIHGASGAEIAQNVLNSSGIRILNWWNRGSRQVTSNRPINTLDDIQGLVIRVPEIAAMVTTWNVMGASPTPMAWAEVYTGLEQGVIEAQENPIPFIYSGRIHEVQNYIALTNHKYEYVTMSMSELFWQGLTPAQQEIIIEAANIATEYQNYRVAELTDEFLASMVADGITVTNPDIAGISAVARTAHEPFAQTIDIDLFNRIMTELGR
ncbi:MAG: TRAP transporter substrate-binding protein [Defluviitaleaceae bacterium]|nr:TRAP transporter substrate-binding protein [Defluviitaleaceae bacterium]